MVKLKIDGNEVQIEKGATILAAAEKAGVKIPTLCFLKKVSPTGACRICVVDIAGVDKPMTACNTVAVDGMAVTTQSERLAKIRRQVVELLLVNHPLDCPVCDAGGECDLQNVCYAHDVTRQPFEAEDVNPDVIDRWPLIQQVPNRCILCEKCVKVCHEVVGSSALFVNDKGDAAFIDKHLELCEFCGNCVQVCPTGTMISKTFKFRARPWELRKVPSTCTHCGSHCQIDLNVKQGEVFRVTAEDEVTVNDGNLCIGGFFSYGYLRSPARLVRPMVKDQEAQMPAAWDTALERVAGRFQAIRQESGGGALAGLASPHLSNEENYLFQKLFRVALGSNNIDSEARFGALRTQGVLQSALGLSGASNRLDRIGKAGAVLVFGSDVTAEAPAIDWQIEQACRKRDGKLVTANLRQVKLDRYAHTHLRFRPGSAALLAGALARLVVDLGLADETFLQRFVASPEELKVALGAIDLDQAAAQTGVSRELLEEAARYLGAAESVALVFGADVIKSAEAEDTVGALVNLALVTGALHGDLGGLFPVDEKGNMQGLLDMGVCPEALPGHQDYAAARPAFEAAWKTSLPESGADAPGILEGIEQGRIRALFLAATNPLAFPDSGRWRKALEKVEFLVVQDILASELTAMADVVLPGSAFSEKSGTVTSLDHRVSCLARATDPPGEAREDREILAELFRRLTGQAVVSDELLQEIRTLAPLYSDICFPGGGLCRPCLKAPYAPADGSLGFVPAAGAVAPAEGLQLLSGKLLFHFGTTTTFAPGPLSVAPSGYVEIHPEDAAACGVTDGAMVKISTALDSIKAPVRVTDRVPAGLLFAPYHFADLEVQRLLPAGSNRVSVQVAKA